MLAVFETSFFCPKISDFLILNWGRQLTRTEQLIDCLKRWGRGGGGGGGGGGGPDKKEGSGVFEGGLIPNAHNEPCTILEE